MDHTRLYVGDLPPNITEQELCGLFEQIGTVVSIELISPSAHNACAFVELDLPEAARLAVQRYHGYDLRGSQLIVHGVPRRSRPRGA